MLKKEYILVFVILGLGIAYTILSLLVLITRGKWFKALNKRFTIAAMIITFTTMITSGSVAFSQSETTPSPTPAYGTLTPSEPPPTINPYSVPLTPEPTMVILPPYSTPNTPEPTIKPTPPIVPPYAVPVELGDVNGDLEVDIVDALLIAQHYVELEPPHFFTAFADVDCSTKIDIIDALLVSQKYVELIDEFPTCDK